MILFGFGRETYCHVLTEAWMSGLPMLGVCAAESDATMGSEERRV